MRRGMDEEGMDEEGEMEGERMTMLGERAIERERERESESQRKKGKTGGNAMSREE